MAPPAESASASRTEVGTPRSSRVFAALDVPRRDLGPLLASTLLPFTLILYLALEGGGYDIVVRSEVGIAVWWIVLLGALVGILPVRPLGRAELIGLGLLLALAAWTALGISWSESSERSLEEVSRILVYLGVMALALTAQDRQALPRTLRAVGWAIAVVGALALLSRLQPSLFPEDEGAAVLGTVDRLSYPLNYWNGLAALMALGVPLVLVVAVESRRLVTQALATAALPVLVLAAYYTLSRGGAIEIAVALVVFLALHPRRLEVVPTLATGALGAGLAIAAASQRGALEDNLQNAAATRQGDEMLAVVAVVCAGVALVRVALGLAARDGLLPRPRVSRRTAAVATGIGAAALLALSLAAGAPDKVSETWEDFKDPRGSTGADRFASTSGTGRYQFWESALDAFSSEPVTGIGPGTYEYWWAQTGELENFFIRDAHSVYLEFMAELGIPGLVLILATFGWLFAVGGAKLGRADTYERALLAAALAAAAAFAIAAAIDWVWELTAVTTAFLLVASAVLRTGAGGRRNRSDGDDRALRPRAALAALAAVAIVTIAVPMQVTKDVRQSQADTRAGDLDGALDSARSAEDLAAFAAAPSLQRALVLEIQGDLDAAAAAAASATKSESVNWRTWLTLSRIEAERGNAKASVDAYRAARSLNPRSPLFANPNGS